MTHFYPGPSLVSLPALLFQASSPTYCIWFRSHIQCPSLISTHMTAWQPTCRLTSWASKATSDMQAPPTPPPNSPPDQIYSTIQVWTMAHTLCTSPVPSAHLSHFLPSGPNTNLLIYPNVFCPYKTENWQKKSTDLDLIPRTQTISMKHQISISPPKSTSTVEMFGNENSLDESWIQNSLKEVGS